MSKNALYFLVGSSGSGKTTLLKRVANDFFSDLTVFHFDDIAAPSAEVVRKLGGPEQWQAFTARQWVKRIAESDARLTVLGGQARPSILQRATNEDGLSALHITLIDCGHNERRRRLVEERSQPELDQLDTYAWAAYLRGQADALELEVIDTTSATIEESAETLARSIERFAGAIGSPVHKTSQPSTFSSPLNFRWG